MTNGVKKTFPARLGEWYTVSMLLKLTPEQREAVRQHGGAVEIEDDETQKVYVLMEEELHQRAMQALEERETLESIRAGLDDMLAGRVIPLAEADARIRKKHGFPARDP